MLNLKYLLKNKKEVIDNFQKRNLDSQKIKNFFLIAEEYNAMLESNQKLLAQKNKISGILGQLKNQSKLIKSQMLADATIIKEQIFNEQLKIKELKNKIDHFLPFLPNLISSTTPKGKDETNNVLLKEHYHLGKGKIIDVLPHYQIAVDLDIVDFKRASKMSGSRFWIYKNNGSKMVRALENFMLDTHGKNGYLEMRPPVLVKENIMYGTGQLPKFHDDLFKIKGKNLYLIPTAEVPLTNYYNDEIIDLETPKCFTAFTNCFRAEAGSGGKDLKGLIRSHQFNKVELVKIVSQKTAFLEYEKMVSDVRNLLFSFEIPFREMELCSGDLGFAAMKTIDFEIWIPSERKYREVSSVSYFGDFQGRRAKIRYRDHNLKTMYVHTINGSALAIDRLIAAILENYQIDNETIGIPKKLIKYMGINEIKKLKK